MFARLNLATVAPGVAVDATTTTTTAATGAVVHKPSKLKEQSQLEGVKSDGQMEGLAGERAGGRYSNCSS